MSSAPITINPLYVSDGRDTAAWKQEKASRRVCGLCRSIPWVELVSVLLSVAALVVWRIYSERIFKQLIQLLQMLNVSADKQEQAAKLIQLVQGVVLVVICTIFGIILVTAAVYAWTNRRWIILGNQHPTARGRGCRTMSYQGVMVVLLLLLWLLLAALILLAMIYFALTVGSLLGATAAAASSKITNQLADDINPKLQDLQTSIASASDRFIQLGETAPRVITTMPWFQQLQDQLGPLLQRGSALGKMPDVCPTSCLDLHALQVVVTDPNFKGCLCSQEMLAQLQAVLAAAWRYGLVALVALGVLVAAGSWLLMSGVASYVRAQCELDQLRQRHHQEGQSPYVEWPATPLLTSPTSQPVPPGGGSHILTTEFPVIDRHSWGKGGQAKDQATPAGDHVAGHSDQEAGLPTTAPNSNYNGTGAPGAAAAADAATTEAASTRSRRRWHLSP